MEYEAKQVAEWFLSKQAMTPKKLQKLVYYAYAWTLTLKNMDRNHLNIRLFNEPIIAWVHGPVVKSVYNEYRDYSYREIPRIDNYTSPFTSSIEDVLNQVLDVYGDYTADQLESITHQESPWRNARKGLTPLDYGRIRIKDQDIFDCYSARLNK